MLRLLVSLKQIITIQQRDMKVFNSEYSYLCLQSTLWQTMGTPRPTHDVTLWISHTTDNSNFFIGFREVRDNEHRLYMFLIGNIDSVGLSGNLERYPWQPHLEVKTIYYPPFSFVFHTCRTAKCSIFKPAIFYEDFNKMNKY